MAYSAANLTRLPVVLVVIFGITVLLTQCGTVNTCWLF